MGALKKLAGETAIYGLSSIIGRVINYLLVPLHTTVFFSHDMGIITGLYAYVALINILFTAGMETAYFRFSKKHPEREVFKVAYLIVAIISIFGAFLIFWYAPELAAWAKYPEAVLSVQLLAIILMLDALVAIPFARMRSENKAKKFALARLSAIALNITMNFVFLGIPLLSGKWKLPVLDTLQQTINSFELGVGFVFLANLIGNLIFIPFVFSYLKDLKSQWNYTLFREMLAYSWPIVVLGLSGMLTEQVDKLLIPYLLPENFYPGISPVDAQGIYGPTVKLSILMMLAIQAFRYAGEPFFFARANDPTSPSLFARVMHYFVLFGALLLLVISANLDWIAPLFLRQSVFRTALYLVPLLLLGKLLFGIFVNLSIWFKLTDQTQKGISYSLAGAISTLLFAFIFIPIWGFYGAAGSVVVGYLSMNIFCYFGGQKYYPIPYKLPWILSYILISFLISQAIVSYSPFSGITAFFIHNAILVVCLLLTWLIERKRKAVFWE